MRSDEKFDAATQDRIAAHLMQQRGLGKFERGQMSREALQNNLAKEWASLPTTAGGGHYAGQRAHVSGEAVAAPLRGQAQGIGVARAGAASPAAVATAAPPPSALPNPVAPPAQPPNTTPGPVQASMPMPPIEAPGTTAAGTSSVAQLADTRPVVNPRMPPPPIEGTSNAAHDPDLAPGAHPLPQPEGERMRAGGGEGAPAPSGGGRSRST